MSPAPAAILEMLHRFYGTGPLRHFGEVQDVYARRPYEAVSRALHDLSGLEVEDTTDTNDDVSFGYAFGDYVLYLSMVGPFAMLVRSEAPSVYWTPLHTPSTYFEQEILGCVQGHGFSLLSQESLEIQIEAWPDEPPISLFNLLFIAEGEPPWAG